jgi:LPS-assembly lipoprotein
MSSSRLISAVFALTLAGCGFQPLYGEHSAGTGDVAVELAKVSIPIIPDRIGQLVRNQLIDTMTPHGQPGTPDYVLTVQVKELSETQTLRFDSTASRLRYTLFAQFQVTAGSNQVAKGSARSVVSYDLPNSSAYYYTSVASQREAEMQAARDVADQIKTRVAMAIARKNNSPSP